MSTVFKSSSITCVSVLAKLRSYKVKKRLIIPINLLRLLDELFV